ncbi:MAG: T9SS type A sorting domain-containing protein [Flavobacteriales bacterium]|nr:T9SS type A sorting domain-containing protein [Flavobacteriales bacterium]
MAQINYDFESWSGNEPSSWLTFNQAPGVPQTTFQETASPGEGSSSVRLQTTTCGSCGMWFLSDPLPGLVMQEIPFTQRPISLDLLYKSNPQPGDVGGLMIQLTKWNAISQERDILGEGWFSSQIVVSSWTSVNVPVAYVSTDIPDSMTISIVSSIGHSMIPVPGIPAPINGSEFFVDALNLNLPSCAGFTVTTTGTDETSLLSGDGTATANPSGGTPPYSYMWNTGETTSNIGGLIPGLYNCTVTDANGCVKVSNYYIVLLGGCNGLSVSIATTNASSLTSNDGSAIATVIGGAGPYTYFWNTGASAASISGLDVGAYAVEVIDASGNCVQWGYGVVNVGAGGTGVDDILIEGLVDVFPNPSLGIFTVSTRKPMSRIMILNALGEIVQEESPNTTSSQVDLTNQPSGIYFLFVKAIGGHAYKGRRIVVQH